MTFSFGSVQQTHANTVPELLAELQALVSDELLLKLHNTEEILRPDDEEHVKSVLRRFLAAEKLDVQKALIRLEKHANWREETIPNGGIPEVWFYFLKF